MLTKLQPAPRPLFAKAASTKAIQEAKKGGPPAPSEGDLATVAFLRGRVSRLAEEVGHLEGQVVQAEEELTEEKAAGARLRQRVRRLEEELEDLGQANEALQNEVEEARVGRAEQEERIAELELKVLNMPDAQKIQPEVLDRVEEAWGARHQALTLSFQGMAFTMEEREASLEGALRRQEERNEQLEERLVDLVAAEVRRLLQAQVPKEETPEQGGVVTPRAASPALPSTPRPATPAAMPEPAPRNDPAAFPSLPNILSMRPSRQATPALGVARTLAGLSQRVQSTSPISALRRQASSDAGPSAITLRAFSVPPTPGYSSRANGGPVAKTWVSPAEQEKAKAKLVGEERALSQPVVAPGTGEAEQEKAKATPTSGDRLLSQPVVAPVAEEADSASAGPQPALPAVLEEGEIREDDGSLDMDTTE